MLHAARRTEGSVWCERGHLVYSRTHSLSNLPFQSAAGDNGEEPSRLSAFTVKPESTMTPVVAHISIKLTS